ncbi:MAG: DEAD/DEAH box helicase family protein [Desulfobacteraceae bacterium]|jgi:superfamily II DNA or RNA helicase
MNYLELLNKYNRLLEEFDQLKKENNRLKLKLGKNQNKIDTGKRDIIDKQSISNNRPVTANSKVAQINNKSDSTFKIKLFMSLFKGRDDIYATKWENKKKVTSGYSPVCLNQWRKGICGKPKIPCSKCENKSYAVLDDNVIDDHLRGNIVVGIYPMLPDETCYFLAMDFDEEEWQRDISIVRETCDEFHIPVAVERSQSGNGAHIWFFFDDPIPASLARKFGTGLLTFSMDRRHELKFKSYDRLFPSQDTLPKGGFGNLIALPFQKSARKNQNSEFVDEKFNPYSDQWAYLSTIKKISEDKIGGLIAELCQGHELGQLKIDEEEDQKPWETVKKVSLDKNEYPRTIDIVKSNMLFIPKNGISEKGLNHLKRLASFKNPMFYKQQAMRLSTYGHSRIITCADDTKDYLCLPRGCEEEVVTEFQSLKVDCQFIDKTNHGKKIDVEFNGELRDDQQHSALEQLLSRDIGILSGTTAFGKTVVAIKLIAERKVKTLILVDRIGLLNQWKDRLKQFLIVNEVLPEADSPTIKKRGRKKKLSIIGQLGAGKNTLNGIVDIAVMQSMGRMGEVKDCIKNYGMIIADECHHAPAFNYENILKTANARYVYGLTATPTRKDGHHPILLMQCGPIRYRDDPKKQAENRPFDHFVIPRFTSLRIPFDRDEKELSINDVYSEIMENDFRDQQIIEDVVENYKLGRNCVVLSQRVEHVETLSEKLKEEIPDVLSLTGKMGIKKAREVLEYIKGVPDDKNIALVATGPYIGEGFDEPRLDTLFLVMPISWKGTLQQYAGRLHRLFNNKKEVLIYDYVDIHQ